MITLKDGTVLEGLGALKGKDSFKFRKNKEEKTSIYSFIELHKAEILVGENWKTYKYFKIKDMKKPLILKEIVVGKACLYHDIKNRVSGGNGFGATGATYGSYTSFSVNAFYVKLQNDSIATHLGSDGVFAKNVQLSASSFFSDCPKLVKKIQDREFRKKDMVAIVEFYNNECTKPE